jgi:hypothetical protein
LASSAGGEILAGNQSARCFIHQPNVRRESLAYSGFPSSSAVARRTACGMIFAAAV